MGVSTPEREHNEQTARRTNHDLSLSQHAVLVSAPRNTSWTVKIQTSEGRKVGKNAQHGPHGTIIFLQFNLPFTSQSLENTEAWNRPMELPRHGTELWAAACPNSINKYPTATGQSIIMTEIKAL